MAQQLVNGVFLGSVYALFAIGYTLIFGVLDILNLAHHAVFTASAFLCLTLMLRFGLPAPVALLLAMLVAGCLGLLLDRLAVRPLRGRPDTHFSVLISSLGMGIIFESIVLGVYGAQLYRFPPGTFPEVVFEGAGVRLTLLQLTIVVVGLAMMLGLTVALRRTRWGKAVRAVAQNARAASLLGIDVDRVIASSFFVASALGGAAGVLSALAFNVLTPDMGRSIELKGLAVIVVGGMGSIPGAVLGGLILGLTEVLSVALTGQSNLRDAIAFTLLFLILLLRPRGLLGARGLREA
ncbi:MAG TPA: branched-chain amino acid ABC transporter permease [Chloroflexota bacterium]|nr:branched-chain amino acid ABC transporter permease [Chloroflexota bacterium]